MRLPEIMRRTGLSKSGVDAFCYSIDLLTLKNRREGRAVLESRFFQAIDSKGKTALDFYWSAALRGSVMSAAPISPQNRSRIGSTTWPRAARIIPANSRP